MGDEMSNKGVASVEPVAWRWRYGDSPWSYGPERPRLAGRGWDKPCEIQPLYGHVSPTAGAPSQAALDVLAERARQIGAEGWTPAHDDEHDRDELSAAAACYAHFGWVRPTSREAPSEWPWAPEWWKPTDRRRDLVKAGALILADIERLDRAESAGGGEE